MDIQGERVLLRVYLQSADRAPRTPSDERIVLAARHAGLAGATVLRGILGAGYHGIIQSSAWSLVEHVPVIVEIVDTAQRIADFVHGPLDQIMVNGMLTLERAAVILYRQRAEPPFSHHENATHLTVPPHYASPDRKGGELPDNSLHGYRDEPKPNPAKPSAPFNFASELKPLSTIPRIQPGDHMNINENGVLLRVFIGESDTFEHKPLYEAIVQKVRELRLAGATVLRGSEGFGARSVVHKARLLEMSTDLPIVIEIVDSEENIKRLLPHLETMVREGMITMEYVTVLMYRHEGR